MSNNLNDKLLNNFIKESIEYQEGFKYGKQLGKELGWQEATDFIIDILKKRIEK